MANKIPILYMGPAGSALEPDFGACCVQECLGGRFLLLEGDGRVGGCVRARCVVLPVPSSPELD